MEEKERVGHWRIKKGGHRRIKKGWALEDKERGGNGG